MGLGQPVLPFSLMLCVIQDIIEQREPILTGDPGFAFTLCILQIIK